MKFTHYFPYDNYRPSQYQVISDVLEAIDSEYSEIIIDAPTGFGKSGVVRTVNDTLVAENGYKSYILTATKNLQNQYFSECKNSEYVDYDIMKGRSNYKCLMNNNSADVGYCKTIPSNQRNDCMYKMRSNPSSPCNNGGCLYWKAKCDNICSDTSIMNYNVLMADLIHSSHFDCRPLMFCDEAHNIENKIMNEVSIVISNKSLNRFFDISLDEEDFRKTDIDYWIGYIKSLLNLAYEKLEIIRSPYSDFDAKTAEEIYSFTKGLEWKSKEIEHSGVEWIVCPNYRARTIELKPLSIQRYSRNYLLDGALKHIYLSGTFVDTNQWIDDIGLKDECVKVIKAETSFDLKKNNPIYRRWVGNMSMKQKSKTLPLMVKKVKEILEENKGKCGIIHCHSKENADYLMKNLDDGRLITYQNSYDKEKQLELFKNSSNLVMCAYSLEEGLDLPYDGIRFQIFLKTPFPSLADNQIRARMKKDKRWYEILTARKLLQSWGRGMRAEDDWCKNYMLDTGFNAIIKKDFMPKEFKGALQ